MLFSLVLAVASKEVELWQAFDDFSPRRLMEDEVDDSPEDMEGEEQNDDEEGEEILENGEGEEDEMALAQFAIPAALGVVAVGGGLYFLLNKKDKNEGKNDDALTFENFADKLQDGDQQALAAAAAATLAVVGGGYTLMSSGSTGPITNTSGFLTGTNAALGLGTATAVGAGGWYADLHHKWPLSKLFGGGDKPSPPTPVDTVTDAQKDLNEKTKSHTTAETNLEEHKKKIKENKDDTKIKELNDKTKELETEVADTKKAMDAAQEKVAKTESK
jgi:hypothetical protein